MQRRLILSLSCFLLGLSVLTGLGGPALATPIYLGRGDAVSDPRSDMGTGLCGSVSKFKNQPSPLSTIDDAKLLLDRPAGDPNITGRVSRLFGTMNFSVGAGSEGDFHAPTFNDDYFPYCLDPMAMPMGTDDNNIVMRIRGYVNITDNLGGKPMTFVAKCDDGCALYLGRGKVEVIQANDDSPLLTGRRAREVVFLSPGLYPVELVYFQNSTTGYLEWSQASLSLFPRDDMAVDNIVWGQHAMDFNLLSGAQLFDSVVGSNPACIECKDDDKDCASGNYCGDGLCQPCNLEDHCGPTCVKCPSDRGICNAGKCVQCTADAMCPTGWKCDAGTCKAPTGCTSNAQCRPPQVCKPDGFCGEPPMCKTDTDCAGNIGCACLDGTSNCPQKMCIVPPTSCVDDSECETGSRCDFDAQLCVKAGDHLVYEGGLTGCSLGRGNRSGALAGLVCFALMLLGARFRRRRISPSL